MIEHFSDYKKPRLKESRGPRRNKRGELLDAYGDVICCDRCPSPAEEYHCCGVDGISGGIVYSFHCASH